MRPWGALPADTKKDLEDYFFCTKEIFPGGLNPRLDELIQAVNPYFEVISSTRGGTTTSAPPPSGSAGCASTRRRSARSGATRCSRTTIVTSAPACGPSTFTTSSLAQFELKRIG
jgi:hypothetical protein